MNKKLGIYNKINIVNHEGVGEIENLESFYKGFERILLKTPYEGHTKFIFRRLTWIKTGEILDYDENLRKLDLEYATKKKSLAEALLACKAGGLIGLKGKSHSFKISPDISKIIEKRLEEEYLNAHLNYEPMTYEEGKEILEMNLYDDVKPFIDDYWSEYAKELGLSAEEHCGHNYEIDDDLIRSYIEGCSVPRKITINQIKSNIKDFEHSIKHNTKNGAPKKNQKLHAGIWVFINLGCEGKANDFKIIYECFDYMGLIDEGLKKQWEISSTYQSEVQYLKSAYKEAKKLSGVNFEYRELF